MNEIIERLRADISNLDEEIARDEARILPRRKLVNELRETLRRYEVATKTDPAPLSSALSNPTEPNPTTSVGDGIKRKVNDLFGKPIVEAARIVMAEMGGSGEYQEVARVALERGYRSHKSGDDADKITRSFYETIRRSDDIFTQDDINKRLFRLKAARPASGHRPRNESRPSLFDREAGPTTIPNGRESRQEPRARVDLIREVMAEVGGRDLSMNAIMDGLNAKDDGLGCDREAFWKTVNSALRRGEKKGWFRKTGTGIWSLVEKGE